MRRVRMYSALESTNVANKLGIEQQRQHLDSAKAEGEVEVSRIGISKKSKTNGIVHEHLDLSI